MSTWVLDDESLALAQALHLMDGASMQAWRCTWVEALSDRESHEDARRLYDSVIACLSCVSTASQADLHGWALRYIQERDHDSSAWLDSVLDGDRLGRQSQSLVDVTDALRHDCAERMVDALAFRPEQARKVAS